MVSGKNVGCITKVWLQNVATQPRHWSATSAEARRQPIDPTQGQPFYLCSSSVHGDDPSIRDEVWCIVNSLVHCK